VTFEEIRVNNRIAGEIDYIFYAAMGGIVIKDCVFKDLKVVYLLHYCRT
jgi:hypothetical protein